MGKEEERMQRNREGRWGETKNKIRRKLVQSVVTFIHCILPDFVFEAGSQEIKPEAIP